MGDPRRRVGVGTDHDPIGHRLHGNAKALVPRTDGDRALYFTCTPRTDRLGKCTQWGFLVPYRCNAPTSSCLPWIYLGLPGSLPYNPLPSALRMALHVYFP